MQTTQQDVSGEIMFKLWPWVDKNKNTLIGIGVGAIALYAVMSFVSAHKAAREQDAGQALTQVLMAPPSAAGSPAEALAKVATDYAGTMSGQRAQLEAAASLYDVGRYADAQTAFQKVLDASASGPLTTIALLGVGTSAEAQGKLDVATSSYQRVVNLLSGTPAAIPGYCGLARVAEAQGKLNEAKNNYESAAHFGQAGGTLAQEAAIKAMELTAKLPPPTKPAAVAPAAPAAAVPAATPTPAPAK